MNDGAEIGQRPIWPIFAARIYQVNPTIFGEDEKFELSDDVKQIKVSDFTGLKPGKSVIMEQITKFRGETTSFGQRWSSR